MKRPDSHRPELPPPPPAVARLPVHRGYPVPYFVAWLRREGGAPSERRGEGVPDFRVVYPGCIAECWGDRRCWVCGTKIKSRFSAFLAGPMCGVNRTSSEPPSHIECAVYAATACPFLMRPAARRRENRLPDGAKSAGIPLARNPGVAMLWVTAKPSLRWVPNGILFDIGPPERIEWYREGREATREEVQASIDSGYPSLLELAEAEGEDAVADLEAQAARLEHLLPVGPVAA